MIDRFLRSVLYVLGFTAADLAPPSPRRLARAAGSQHWQIGDWPLKGDTSSSRTPVQPPSPPWLSRGL